MICTTTTYKSARPDAAGTPVRGARPESAGCPAAGQRGSGEDMANSVLTVLVIAALTAADLGLVGLLGRVRPLRRKNRVRKAARLVWLLGFLAALLAAIPFAGYYVTALMTAPTTDTQPAGCCSSPASSSSAAARAAQVPPGPQATGSRGRHLCQLARRRSVDNASTAYNQGSPRTPPIRVSMIPAKE